jgi:hypothetical protein
MQVRFVRDIAGAAKDNMRNATLTTLRKMLSSLILCSCLTIVAAAQAQPQSNPLPSQDEVNRQLVQRLQELEAELRQWKVQSAALAPASVAPAPALPPVAEPLQAHNAYDTGFAGRVNGPSIGVRYDFDADGTFKLQYDRVSGSICLMRTH